MGGVGDSDVKKVNIVCVDPLRFSSRAYQGVDVRLLYEFEGERVLLEGPEGWGVLKDDARRVHGSSYVLRHVHPGVHERLNQDLPDLVDRVERVSAEEFMRWSEEILRGFVFGRVEENVKSFEEYVRLKEDLPLREVAHHASPNAYERQQHLNAWLESLVRTNPERVGLPDHVKSVAREVRLDSRMGSWVVTEEEYNQFLSGCQRVPVPLTISDLVVQTRDQWYVVEVKVTHSVGSPVYQEVCRTRARRCALKQLASAAVFAQENFGVNPRLVYAQFVGEEGRERLRVQQFVHEYGWLSRVEQNELLLKARCVA